jgi:hypothetical protein
MLTQVTKFRMAVLSRCEPLGRDPGRAETHDRADEQHGRDGGSTGHEQLGKAHETDGDRDEEEGEMADQQRRALLDPAEPYHAGRQQHEQHEHAKQVAGKRQM